MDDRKPSPSPCPTCDRRTCPGARGGKCDVSRSQKCEVPRQQPCTHGVYGLCAVCVDEGDFVYVPAGAWVAMQSETNRLREQVEHMGQPSTDLKLRDAVNRLIIAWSESPDNAGDGLEASFYDVLDELRTLVPSPHLRTEQPSTEKAREAERAAVLRFLRMLAETAMKGVASYSECEAACFALENAADGINRGQHTANATTTDKTALYRLVAASIARAWERGKDALVDEIATALGEVRREVECERAMADAKCDEHVPLATAIALCTGELDEIVPGSEAGDLRRAFNAGVHACIEAFRQYTPHPKTKEDSNG